MFFVAQDGEALSVSIKKPGSECDSDHELLITKFRLKFKKAWKMTRPSRYDLNRIPYAYKLEVTNRFKGLDLIDSAEELWTEVHNTAQGAVTKTILKKRAFKKAK